MPNLSADQIADRVHKLRQNTVIGSCIDLEPYAAAFDSAVVDLRSHPDARYNMQIADPPTLAGQATWRRAYDDRSNDVMWVIRDKSGAVCGTNRLYDIDERIAEKGSLIIKPEIARIVPAALESDLRIIDTAFQLFDVEKIITRVRINNVPMKSMNSRFGFVPERTIDIRGAEYEISALHRDEWDSTALHTIIQHWARRYA